jgi:hypothetical protein
LISVTLARGATGASRPPAFVVNNAQAQEVAAVVNVIGAYNRGDVAAVMQHIVGGQGGIVLTADCNYRTHRSIRYEGREGMERWLRQRYADHDHLIVRRIEGNVGVVDVQFSRRTSDTLRALGYPNGIVPQVAAKVPFGFRGGRAFLAFFALASTNAPTPDPECSLVAAPPR